MFRTVLLCGALSVFAFSAYAEDCTPRVRTHSDPERDDGGKDDSGQEVEGELVVTCGNAPEVLEATERCFDPPAITIAPFIVADEAFA